jgi:hypothetical protein
MFSNLNVIKYRNLFIFVIFFKNINYINIKMASFNSLKSNIVTVGNVKSIPVLGDGPFDFAWNTPGTFSSSGYTLSTVNYTNDTASLLPDVTSYDWMIGAVGFESTDHTVFYMRATYIGSNLSIGFSINTISFQGTNIGQTGLYAIISSGGVYENGSLASSAPAFGDGVDIKVDVDNNVIKWYTGTYPSSWTLRHTGSVVSPGTYYPMTGDASTSNSGNMTTTILTGGTSSVASTSIITIDDDTTFTGTVTTPSVLLDNGSFTTTIVSGATANHSVTLPVGNGTTGYVLSNDGSGVLSYIDNNPFDQTLNAASTPAFASLATTLTTAAQTNVTSVGTLTGLTVDGVGADVTVGTTDAYGVIFKSNGSTNLTLESSGDLKFGIVEADPVSSTENIVELANLSFTTSATQFIVPAGTTFMEFKCWGGGGARSDYRDGTPRSDGGGGGYTYMKYAATAGDEFWATIGERGLHRTSTKTSTEEHGKGGTGADDGNWDTGGGGSYSAIHKLSGGTYTLLCCAGGGGGAGADSSTSTGDGGGGNGGHGYDDSGYGGNDSGFGGSGGTGGAGSGTRPGGDAYGSLTQSSRDDFGGNGADVIGISGAGGGGGGGYGGGGAGDAEGGGGGGGGYVDPAGYETVMTTGGLIGGGSTKYEVANDGDADLLTSDTGWGGWASLTHGNNGQVTIRAYQLIDVVWKDKSFISNAGNDMVFANTTGTSQISIENDGLLKLEGTTLQTTNDIIATVTQTDSIGSSSIIYENVHFNNTYTSSIGTVPSNDILSGWETNVLYTSSNTTLSKTVIAEDTVLFAGTDVYDWVIGTTGFDSADYTVLEYYITTVGSMAAVGVAKNTIDFEDAGPFPTGSFQQVDMYSYVANGNNGANNVSGSVAGTYTTADTIKVIIDNNTITFYKNSVLEITATIANPGIHYPLAGDGVAGGADSSLKIQFLSASTQRSKQINVLNDIASTGTVETTAAILTNGSFATTLTSAASANYGLVLPAAAPTGTQILEVDSSGNFTWLVTPGASDTFTRTAEETISAVDTALYLMDNGKASAETEVIGAPADDEYIAGATTGDNGGSPFGTTHPVKNISMTDDKIFIGENWDSTNTGRVLVYSRGGTWSLDQTITANDATSGDKYGFCVAADGTRLAVSALDDLSVYVLDFSTTYTETQKITGTGAFGRSIGLSGDYLIVGQFTVDDVLVYKWGGASWSLVHTIQPSGTTLFGYTVDLSGDTAIIGDPNASGGGKAYIYDRGVGVETWSLTQTINPLAVAQFGIGVSINGDIAGVAHNHTQKTTVGLHYNGSTWDTFTIVPTTSVGDRSYSVACGTNSLIIGMPVHDAGVNGGGAVIKYDWNGSIFTDETVYEPSTAAVNDNYGYAVATNDAGDTFAVYSLWDNADKGGTTIFVDGVITPLTHSFLGYNTATATVGNPVTIQYRGVYTFGSAHGHAIHSYLVVDSSGDISIVTRGAFNHATQVIRGVVISTTEILLN